MTKFLEPLDILLYKGKGFTSWLIEFGTSSDYSHVALVVDPGLSLGTTKGWNNNFQKEKDYFCSELCYAAFNSAGLDIVPAVPDADIASPGDIAKSEVFITVPSRKVPPCRIYDIITSC